MTKNNNAPPPARLGKVDNLTAAVAAVSGGGAERLRVVLERAADDHIEKLMGDAG